MIQLPLVYVGSWYGNLNSQPYEHPTKTTSIPRQIPPQPWYTKFIYSILLAGLVPFAVIFIELLFVFQSLWQDKSGYYYVFGFLSVVSLVCLVTVIEITIVFTYIQLCAENYNWWWQSVLIGSGSAFWVFMYCVWFYWTRLHMKGFVSGLLFFSYSFLACTVYGLLTGTVGFITAYTFVRRIYGYVPLILSLLSRLKINIPNTGTSKRTKSLAFYLLKKIQFFFSRTRGQIEYMIGLMRCVGGGKGGGGASAHVFFWEFGFGCLHKT